MIQRDDLLALEFYKKTPFTGSYGNMRYRVERIEVPEDPDATYEEGESVPMKSMLQATIWPGPFAFAKTDEDKKIRHQESHSEEGMVALVAWLNEQASSF